MRQANLLASRSNNEALKPLDGFGISRTVHVQVPTPIRACKLDDAEPDVKASDGTRHYHSFLT